MWRAIATIVLLTGVIRANDALADWFYPALQIKCKEAENKLSILNVSAYNEAGIKGPSESEGIYVPDNWPMQKGRYVEKTHACQLGGTRFSVKVKPIFLSTGGGGYATLEVTVLRNGQLLLGATPLDNDVYGQDEGSYIESIAIAESGAVEIQRSCMVAVHLHMKCREPNRSMERTR